MNNEQNDRIKNLITNYLTGEISSADRQVLSDWRSLNADNEEFFQQFEKVFHLTRDQTGTIQDIDLDAEWQHFLELKDEKTTIHIGPDMGRSSWWKIAAAVVLLVVGIYGGYFLIDNNTVVVKTAETTQKLTLPDGSVIDLNRNSTLSYQEGFNTENRSVNLNGEAFFSVKTNAELPFTVKTGVTQVTVLGTQFNINAYDDLETVEVTVREGLVSFSSDQDTLELSRGEKGVYGKDSKVLTEQTNDDINFLSWKTKELFFREDNLRTVIETLNKVYGDRIIIASDISDSCEVTVTFNQQSLEAVLNVLKSTLNLTFKTVNNRIEIVDAQCE